MNETEAFTLLYGGLDKLAPGNDATTIEVLRSLPDTTIHRVVDAGCGNGRQTLALARELDATIDAVDLYQVFLDELNDRAKRADLTNRVATHCMDMSEIPDRFAPIDLLWAEGSAYSIGFANAMHRWRPALSPGGLLVASELVWLMDNPPEHVKAFWAEGYPDIRSVDATIAICEAAGLELLHTHDVPHASWVDGYYGPLKPRATSLLDHDDAMVRGMAEATLREIEVFHTSEQSYGYVFFCLRAPTV